MKIFIPHTFSPLSAGDEDAPPPLDPVDSSGQARDQLYEKATELAKKGKLELALNAYLSCLKGLQKNAGFTYLPQCLHSVSLSISVMCIVLNPIMLKVNCIHF